MTPEQAMRLMAAKSMAIGKAGNAVSLDMLRGSATKVANRARTSAAMAGHEVNIKVSARDKGVRVTVSGPKAKRYRQMISRELNALVPETKADITAQITRQVR
jgi:hypothetical protein